MPEETHPKSSATPGTLEIKPWWGRLIVGRRPKVTLIRLILVVTTILLLTKFCFVPVRVTGRSMEPTLNHGRLSLINLLAYKRSDPQRGDMISIRRTGRRMVMLKRILGLPNERVEIGRGRVRINGELMTEPYAKGHKLPVRTETRQLGTNQYFVIGDNRNVSEYGVIERSEILGKLLF